MKQRFFSKTRQQKRSHAGRDEYFANEVLGKKIASKLKQGCLEVPYIITGPPGAGKSTLIEALRQAGYPCADEVSRNIIIKEQKDGKDGMPWKNLSRFTRLVFEQTIHSLQSDKNALFCDRGLPDNLAYLRQAGMEIPDYLKNFPFEAHYQRKVFYTPLWEEIYKTDPQRPDAIETAAALDLQLRRTYDEMGFELTFIPFDSPARRAVFVISQIKI